MNKKTPQLSLLDRLMATRWHPECIKDLDKFENVKKTGDEGLIVSCEYDFEQKWGISIVRIQNAEKQLERALRGENSLSSVKVVTAIEEKPIVRFKFGKSENNKSTEKHWERGEHLYLKVDLNYSRPDLQRDFLKIMDKYQKRPKCFSRITGKTKISPWVVYRMTKTGEKLVQITEDLSESVWGEKKVRYYSYDWDTCYRLIERAFDKAKKMISMIKPNLS